MSNKQPAVFLPHGGGPFSYVDLGVDPHEVDGLVRFWKSIGSGHAASEHAPPKAVLVVSAHWEESVPTVMASKRPPMLFDYDGFPPESYTLDWPAPGDPELAARVRELLAAQGIESRADAARGFDHGVFVPLGRSFPNADIPTIQLSLQRNLDPREHLRMGRALAPLRSEGVLMIGSGMSYHNFAGFRRGVEDPEGRRFDTWLRESVGLPYAQRCERLAEWTKAPGARAAHPRAEHLLPLMVLAGASEGDLGRVSYHGKVFRQWVAGIEFGS